MIGSTALRVAVSDEISAMELKEGLQGLRSIEILAGPEAVEHMARDIDADLVRELPHLLRPPHGGYAALRAALAEHRARFLVPGDSSTLARRIEVNLERWRWLPRALEDQYVVVNSATFVLELVERDQPVLSMRAVVGRPDWPTPITSSRITDLVFRPVWYVPRTIAVKELLPILQRDPGYLAREGIRVFADSAQGGGLVDATAIDWTQINASTFTYLLAQEPGSANPLGAVKFMFWTPFSVFIHDTPQRPAFSERSRAFSHGCVRIESAAALAARLLPNWPADSVSSAMQSGRERWVGLPQSIPVYLVYRTAWVTEEGLVAFAGDPYGWDGKLAQALKPTGMFP